MKAVIDFHIDWKDSPGVRDPVLARTWCALTIRVHGEPITRVSDRRTAEESNLCAWSARLGINAHYDDELSDTEAKRLKTAIGRLDGRMADDLLDASAIKDISSDLDWINEAHRRASTARRTSSKNTAVHPLSLRHSPRSDERTAYAAGYRQARALREQSGLGNDRLPDLGDLMRRLGWADTPMFATDKVPSSGLDAVVDYGREGVPVVAAHSLGRETSERFLLARSLFLQTCSPNSERRLVTGSHTWDQRASRAFAAELLAPADALRQRIRGQEVSAREVAQYADEFLVNPTLVERQLENHALAYVDRGRQDLRQW